MAGIRGLDGGIDTVAVWSRALSAGEIQARATAPPLSGSETGLAGHWRFDEASGQAALDAGPNANHGTLGASSASDNADPSRQAAGSSQIVVPDVTGLTQAAAQAELNTAGLAVGGVSTASSDTVPAGRVISQQPAGGASVAPGASVALVVSTGVATVSGYLDFDGVNDRVVVPSSTSLRLANAVTVEAWIRPRTITIDTGTAQDRVVRKGGNYELTISTGDTSCAGGTAATCNGAPPLPAATAASAAGC